MNELCHWCDSRPALYYVVIRAAHARPEMCRVLDKFPIHHVCAYCVGSRRCRNNWVVVSDEEAILYLVHHT
jgi:hypothetical protein